jgi:hypothetical protein
MKRPKGPHLGLSDPLRSLEVVAPDLDLLVISTETRKDPRGRLIILQRAGFNGIVQRIDFILLKHLSIRHSVDFSGDGLRIEIRPPADPHQPHRDHWIIGRQSDSA